MDGVTDSVYRQIVALHGKPDVIFTEFTNVGDICRGRGLSLDSLRYSEVERPIVAQLYGKDPDLFYQAAQVVCELGFDGLDINMGCPSKNVASSGSGAALIRTPDLALKIMQSARQGIHDWAEGQELSEIGLKRTLLDMVRTLNQERSPSNEILSRCPIPLTVKTRLGYDLDIIDEWSECLIRGKPEVISIHGRTLAQMYKGQSNWESISSAATRIRERGILVMGNGDIGSLEEARQRILDSNVHGVLIGRAALGNPWIFTDISTLRRSWSLGLKREVQSSTTTLEERFRLMIDHAQRFEFVNGLHKFPRMRKHLGWYCSAFPYAAAMRAQMVRTNCSQDVVDLLKTYTVSQAQTNSSSLVSAST